MRNGSMRVLVAATGVICALGMVAGCGGKDSADAAASASGTAQSVEDYNIRFAQCLRDAGFNVSDPSNDQDPRNENVGGDAAAFNEAAQKCQEKLGTPPGGDGSQDLNNPDTIKEGIAMGEGLRSEGYDVKDPEPGKGLSLDLGTIPDSAIQKCADATSGK